MLKSKTVFIVGAGASQDVGLPVGRDLKTQIAKLLTAIFDDWGARTDRSPVIDTILNSFPTEREQYLEACRQIAKGVVHTSSIDDLISNFQHDERVAICAKLAISRAILDAEKKSTISIKGDRSDSTISFDSIENTWYPQLYNILTYRASADTLDTMFANVTIICFNYDRCIEHYLVHALVDHWGMPLARAKSLVQNLTILRPYGSVGSYFNENNKVGFGHVFMPTMTSTSMSIRTYTEKVADHVDMERIHKAISNAEMLVFLGMAYHANNMDLLVSRNPPNVSPKRVFGTRLGISDFDLIEVRTRIDAICHHRRFGNPHEYINFTGINDKCSKLFDDFRISMRS